MIKDILRDYNNRLTDWFNEDIGKEYETFRLQGYADAINQMAKNVEALSYTEKENWRLDAYEFTKTTSSRLRRTVKLVAFSKLIFDIIRGLVAFMFVLAAIDFLIEWNWLVFVMPVAMAILGFIFNKISLDAIHHHIFRIYQEHGYSEGIISLTDTKNLHHIEDDLEIPLHL